MNTPTPDRPARMDSRFFIIVSALMLLIMALLAGLWLSTHRRAVQAEAQLQRLRREADAQGLFRHALLERRLFATVDRGGLATRTVRLDGREVRALRLPAKLGEMLGFEGGDVIVVEEAPATAPATAPDD